MRKKQAGTRVALMTLTDGQSDIQALEDKPLMNIDKLGIGMIVQIAAGSEVRNGLIMLAPSNIEVIYTP